MGRILVWTICTIVVLSLVVTVARAIGNLDRSLEAMVFDPGNCAQPCWHGIQPGKTTLEQAERILRADTTLIAGVRREEYPFNLCDLTWQTVSKPAYRGCAQSIHGVIVEISIDDAWRTKVDEGIGLTDAMIAFGSPTASEVCGPAMSSGILYIADGVEVSVGLYPGGRIVMPSPGNDPGVTIMGIDYHQPGGNPLYAPDTPRWRGFEIPVAGFTPPSRYHHNRLDC